MDHMSKHGKWGEYGEAIELNKCKKGSPLSGKWLHEDRTGTTMETLGLQLLHKNNNNNNNKQRNKINTHISMLESRRARSCQTFFCFARLFFILNLPIYSPSSPVSVYRKLSISWGAWKHQNKIKAGCFIYCQQIFQITFKTRRDSNALETSPHSIQQLSYTVVRLP